MNVKEELGSFVEDMKAFLDWYGDTWQDIKIDGVEFYRHIFGENLVGDYSPENWAEDWTFPVHEVQVVVEFSETNPMWAEGELAECTVTHLPTGESLSRKLYRTKDRYDEMSEWDDVGRFP